MSHTVSCSRDSHNSTSHTGDTQQLSWPGSGAFQNLMQRWGALRYKGSDVLIQVRPGTCLSWVGSSLCLPEF